MSKQNFDSEELVKLFHKIHQRLDWLTCAIKECCSKIPINIGDGIGLFKRLANNKWEFKSLVEGDNITITETTEEIIISSQATPFSCEDVNECLGISDAGESNKFLNEQGDFVTVSGSGFTCSDLNACSTSNLQEGSRLYFTNSRAVTALTGQNISLFTNNSGYITETASDLKYYPLTNPDKYISSISSSDVITALGYTPYNNTNPSGFITSSSLTPYLLVSTASSTYEPIIISGTTSQYYRGDKTFQTLDKSTVGLSNVDNTSDNSKPVSTATQTALDLKANKNSVPQVLFCSVTKTTVTSISTETSLYSIPLPTDGSNYSIKVYSQAQADVYFSPYVRHRLRIGTYLNPIDGAVGANAISNQTQLAIYAVTSAAQCTLTRNFVYYGGATGSITGIAPASNVTDDAVSSLLFSTAFSGDLTTQHYLYVTIQATNTSVVATHNQILVTIVKV